MATTTTFGAIRNQIVSVIEALTPATMNRAEDKFRRCPDKRQLLETWAIAHASDGCFRKFDLRRSGDLTDPEVLDPSAIMRRELATLTMAYPVAPALYGPNDLDSMEDVIASDAQQVRDAVFSPGNLLTGQIASIVTIHDVDRADESVWFQRFTLEIIYYHAQTLT